MTTDPGRWKKIEQLFAAAIEMPEQERAAFLTRECAGDDALRKEVEKLLHHDENSEGWIAAPIAEVAQLASDVEAEPRRERIGPYSVERELGRGGMGAVYLATRDDDQYRKQVAIKLVPGVADSNELLQRFRAERQILATLEHPNIARLLDGAATEDGMPYLVMEYVEGEPIDCYCERKQLTVEQRLLLFLDVCAAIEHAHRNLVVHRDIKPGNILVTEDGTPKLLDFGIAKLLDPSLASSSMVVTSTAQRLMTPEYASPEQVRGDAIGTGSDVYSLGVLLYQLLSGKRPYDFAKRSLTDIERAICLDEPPRPSASAEATGARRFSTDLDDIVLMAMRKEPTRRYASVGLLVQDIRNYLDGMPVSARPDTWSYRSGKFIRRHRWSLGVASLVLMLIAGFGVTMAVQAKRIAHERDTAEQVTEFLVGMFEVADPYEGRADEMTAREVLDRGTERIKDELQDSPQVRSRLLQVLGNVNNVLGEFRAAIPLREDRLKYQREAYGEESLEVAHAMTELGTLHWEVGNYDRAGELIGPARRILREKLGPDDPAQLDVMFNAAMLRFDTNRIEESVPILEEALALAERAYESPHESIAHAIDLLATSHSFRHEYERALELQMQAKEQREALFGEDDLALALSWHNIAHIQMDLGDDEASLNANERALEIRLAHLEEDHPDVAASLNSKGVLLRRMGRYTEAVSVLERCLEIRRKQFQGDHPRIQDSINNLALAMSNAEDDRAADLQREALAMSQRLNGDNVATGWDWSDLGWILYQQQDCEEAVEALTQAKRLVIDEVDEQDPLGAVVIKNLANAEDCEGDTQSAERHYLEAIEHGKQNLPGGHSWLGTLIGAYGAFLSDENRLDEAEAVLREALAIRVERMSEGHVAIAAVKTMLGRCLLRQGKHADAETLLLAGFEGGDVHDKRKAALSLIELYEATGRADETARYREAAES